MVAVRAELFQQQQKLRTYYNFVNVDSVRYTVGGQKKMFVSAVRETPLYEPVPWLAYWGQRFMLFTHGFGLVMAPAGVVDAMGEPDYVSKEIPIQARWPEIARKPPLLRGSASTMPSERGQHEGARLPGAGRPRRIAAASKRIR